MRLRDLRYLILSDLYRKTGSIKPGAFIKQVLFGDSFNYILWYRICRFTLLNPVLKKTIYPLVRLYLMHLSIKYGIVIHPSIEIGSGLHIGHFGNISVSIGSVIGKNATIRTGVAIARSTSGSNQGCPIIGDNVYIGPGVKIIGALTIHNNVALGANCVVTKDIPANVLAVGIPARVKQEINIEELIQNTNYDEILRSKS